MFYVHPDGRIIPALSLDDEQDRADEDMETLHSKV